MAKWIAFGVLIACTVLLAEAQRYLEYYTYVTYRINTMCRTQSSRSCAKFLWWETNDCTTNYYCEYYTVTESINTQGARCQRGWSPFSACNVLNPCDAGTSGCEHRCVYGGTNASYTCSCNIGYELANDGHKCELVDECTKRGNDCRNMDNSICQFTSGGYQCVCKDGFTSVDPQRCSDIDECKTLANACNQTENSVCQNTVGGYKCNCKEGFRLVESQECLDIDECGILEGNCTMYENLTCENTIGSYKCHCPVGFENADKFHCGQTEEYTDAGFLSLSRGGQIGVIVAIVVGGVLVITFVVVTIVVCYRKKHRKITDNSGSNQLDVDARTTEDNVYDSPDLKITSAAKMKFSRIFSRKQKSSNDYSSNGVSAGSQEPIQEEPLKDVHSFYEELSATSSPRKNQYEEKPYEALRRPLENVNGETFDVNTSEM